jgi:hypothetical protein
MLPNIQSLKQWSEIQNNPRKYTKIKLIKTYEFTKYRRKAPRFSHEDIRQQNNKKHFGEISP